MIKMKRRLRASMRVKNQKLILLRKEKSEMSKLWNIKLKNSKEKMRSSAYDNE